MSRVVLAYITLPSLKVGQTLSRALLRERLVACTNLFPSMESHYSWKGKREVSREVVMIAKTTASQAKRLERFVLKHHPYECPCILFVNAVATSGYAAWLKESTDEQCRGPRPSLRGRCRRAFGTNSNSSGRTRRNRASRGKG